MEYRIGNAKKIKEHGLTALLTCPKCQKKVQFSVFSNGETTLSAEPPFVGNGNVYFLVCPECSAVFGVDESKGDLFKKDKLGIGNFDFIELKEFHV